MKLSTIKEYFYYFDFDHSIRPVIEVHKNFKGKETESFAESINSIYKQFSKHFIMVFGRALYEWMKCKMLAVQSEIISTKKSIKQIIIETGFNTVQSTKFCKNLKRLLLYERGGYLIHT